MSPHPGAPAIATQAPASRIEAPASVRRRAEGRPAAALILAAAVAATCTVASAAPLGADDAPAAGQPIHAGPCDAPECRQFDFWVGDWDVSTPDGNLAGTNKVERILGGCVIAENWSGSKGTNGKSFNIYSAADKKWHQTWVDDEGTLLALAGEFHDGMMVLEGDAPGASETSVRNRITWDTLPGGRVRQHWEISSDGGLKWTDAFVGIYTPKAKVKPVTGGKKR